LRESLASIKSLGDVAQTHEDRAVLCPELLALGCQNADGLKVKCGS
jgi:hypothetical protein